MAIDNPNAVDGMAIDKERNALVLLLTDHLAWEGEDAISELDHLKLLQDKINAYISFLESGQFKENYPDEEFAMAVIETHFNYAITENCKKFLNAVQDQVGQSGIKIEALIGE